MQGQIKHLLNTKSNFKTCSPNKSMLNSEINTHNSFIFGSSHNRKIFLSQLKADSHSVNSVQLFSPSAGRICKHLSTKDGASNLRNE